VCVVTDGRQCARSTTVGHWHINHHFGSSLMSCRKPMHVSGQTETHVVEVVQAARQQHARGHWGREHAHAQHM
jgi:hypothetical protein